MRLAAVTCIATDASQVTPTKALRSCRWIATQQFEFWIHGLQTYKIASKLPSSFAGQRRLSTAFSSVPKCVCMYVCVCRSRCAASGRRADVKFLTDSACEWIETFDTGRCSVICVRRLLHRSSGSAQINRSSHARHGCGEYD